jgi:hypothetical protein
MISGINVIHVKAKHREEDGAWLPDVVKRFLKESNITFKRIGVYPDVETLATDDDVRITLPAETIRTMYLNQMGVDWDSFVDETPSGSLSTACTCHPGPKEAQFPLSRQDRGLEMWMYCAKCGAWLRPFPKERD